MPKRPVRYEKQKKNRERALRERESLSYEDVPLEDYNREEPVKLRKPPKRVVRLLLILALCCFAVILWANRASLAPDRVSNWVQNTLLGMGVGGGYPIGLSGSKAENGNFQLLKDSSLAVVSDTSFNLYNDSAKELAERQHSYSSPVLKVDGAYSMIYHQGGAGFQIETAAETLLTKHLDQNIISGSVSESGAYGVVTQSKNYLGELTIYLKDHSEKYKYYFSEWYPMELSISADGTWGAVFGIAAQDGTAKSIVYVFDFNQQEPKAKFEFSDNLLLSIRCLTSGNVAAVGNKSASILFPNAQKRTDFDYAGRTLSNYEMTPSNGLLLALAKSSDGRSCDLLRIDTKGKTAAEFTIGRKVNSISFFGGKTGVLSLNGQLAVYNDLGDETGVYDAGSDARKVLLDSNSSAYVLGVSQIRKVFF